MSSGLLSQILRTALIMILLSGAASAYAATAAEETIQPMDGGSITDVSAGEGELVEVDRVSPDIHLPRTCPPTLHWELTAGYRFWSLSGELSRVAPYDDPGSGVTGSFSLDRLGKDLKLSVDASLVSEHDYQAELDLDKASRYRFNLSTTTFRHNLDYLPPAYGSPTPYAYDYQVPRGSYALDNSFNGAHFRYRLTNYPLHVNLHLWQFLQEGDRQLRFADHGRYGTGNVILSRTREVDSAVTEAAASIDGHFGPMDVIYSLTWRELDDRTSVPSYSFVERPDQFGNLVRSAGRQEHNAIPESRYLEQSVNLHTSMTGRVVGAASYSLALRDNRGSLADTSMAERPSDTVQNGAADLNLTLSPQLSLVLRYRLLTIDKDGPASVSNSFYVSNPIQVRPGVDLRKNRLTAAILYRPFPLTTIKGEYAGEFLHRSGNGSWPLLDEDVESHRGTLSIQTRPVKGVRLRGSYSFTAASSPTYGTSYDQRHDAQLGANYLAAGKATWGGSLSARFVEERNGYQVTRTAGNLPRDRSLASSTAMLWVSPLSSLTLTGTAGFHRNDMEQTVLFEMSNASSAVESSYLGEVRLFGLMATHRPLEQLTLSAGYQNIHSRGSFDPDVREFSPGRNTSGIQAISRVDMREEVLSLRADYRYSRNISCGVEYLFREYDSRTSSLLDGTLHRVMASLTSRW